VVQRAVREVLEAVYEPVFLDVSYGFRPRRRACPTTHAAPPTDALEDGVDEGRHGA
jgi:hypothetical protein